MIGLHYFCLALLFVLAPFHKHLAPGGLVMPILAVACAVVLSPLFDAITAPATAIEYAVFLRNWLESSYPLLVAATLVHWFLSAWTDSTSRIWQSAVIGAMAGVVVLHDANNALADSLMRATSGPALLWLYQITIYIVTSLFAQTVSDILARGSPETEQPPRALIAITTSVCMSFLWAGMLCFQYPPSNPFEYTPAAVGFLLVAVMTSAPTWQRATRSLSQLNINRL